MGNQDAPKAPAGWYPIEEGKPGERYWDGNAWTGDLRGINEQAFQSTNKGTTNSWFTKYKTTVIVTLIIVAVVATGISVFALAGIKSSTETTTKIATPVSTESQGVVVVPDVMGMHEKEANEALKKLGLHQEGSSDYPAWTVHNIDPPAGTEVKRGSYIKLFFTEDTDPKGSASGSNTWIPQGFSAFNNDLAYQWNLATGPSPDCAGSCQYADLLVSSHFGCPNGVYVEINFLSAGVVVDWSNDTVPALGAGQTAQLQFVSYQTPSGSQTEVVKMSCN